MNTGDTVIVKLTCNAKQTIEQENRTTQVLLHCSIEGVKDSGPYIIKEDDLTKENTLEGV